MRMGFNMETIKEVETLSSKDLSDLFFRAINKQRQKLKLTDLEKEVLTYVNIKDIDNRG